MKAFNAKKWLRGLVLLLALVLAFVLLHGVYRAFYRRAYPLTYYEVVQREAARNQLPSDLVFAVIRTESGFRPHVQSSVGARGLMQLTEETFDWTKWKLGDTSATAYDDLYDPKTNICYGTALLRLLYNEFQNDDTVLCAYHAGWGNAKKWLSDTQHSSDGVTIYNIPFGDTKKYVEKVNKTRAIYRKLYKF